MYKQWTEQGDGYRLSGKAAKKLPPGFYDITTDNYDVPLAAKADLRTESILSFDVGPMPLILSSIDLFWANAARYAEMGLAHKRGILLKGPAGTGKTSILRKIIQLSVARGCLVIQFQLRMSDAVDALTDISQVEKDREIVLLFEDVDETAKHSEHNLLELLDGIGSHAAHMLTIATTNHFDNLSDRLLRPSRFDQIIEIGAPDVRVRSLYLEHLLQKPYPDDAARSVIVADIAARTAGMSLAELKEVVVFHCIYSGSIDESIARIRDVRSATLTTGEPTTATESDEDDDDDDVEAHFTSSRKRVAV